MNTPSSSPSKRHRNQLFTSSSLLLWGLRRFPIAGCVYSSRPVYLRVAIHLLAARNAQDLADHDIHEKANLGAQRSPCRPSGLSKIGRRNACRSCRALCACRQFIRLALEVLWKLCNYDNRGATESDLRNSFSQHSPSLQDRVTRHVMPKASDSPLTATLAKTAFENFGLVLS